MFFFASPDGSVTEPDMNASFCPEHKSPMVLFLDRVYGVEDQSFLLNLLEVGFLPDLRVSASLDTVSGSTYYLFSGVGGWNLINGSYMIAEHTPLYHILFAYSNRIGSFLSNNTCSIKYHSIHVQFKLSSSILGFICVFFFFFFFYEFSPKAIHNKKIIIIIIP